MAYLGLAAVEREEDMVAVMEVGSKDIEIREKDFSITGRKLEIA